MTKINANKVRGKIFIISGPSGAGEDSVIAGLRKKISLNRVITTATRPQRPGESQGRPYYFITKKTFKKIIKQKLFIEWALVYGDYRGCTKTEIHRLIKKNKPILWKVDWHGVKTIKKLFPKTTAIFLAPPSYQILEQRLIKRGKDSLNRIKSRKKFTEEWLKHKDVYDYIVVNQEGKLQQTINKTVVIIKKEISKKQKDLTFPKF
ncbi:MAG: guanylate kinase [Candidatus Buchananbacteria bacterium RIFCSPHIGHO2_01_FULL_39_14]|uniref:Guanylate kinase n=2 Tax=Candidatus Buchananiibacteriota TaxID=1817903 RepID=A0A1G1YQA9_9BACT|nr:MAG: guanylate kinase [Candidatus Buchananbacteria bacterium RIFCSPHIGHO2_01_FULL_39_14]OGY48683.1 MAG: guanylate kinase [Candidatus Buchananbacteria bacterium RIFCSPHIGHO2_02_FULL_39_17]OGY54543.1 MAG: guanylate kinase [Candidatus Buchananbacteria bacterium RIFCSPLOWO2_01_FULL_40_23b]